MKHKTCRDNHITIYVHYQEHVKKGNKKMSWLVIVIQLSNNPDNQHQSTNTTIQGPSQHNKCGHESEISFFNSIFLEWVVLRVCQQTLNDVIFHITPFHSQF